MNYPEKNPVLMLPAPLELKESLIDIALLADELAELYMLWGDGIQPDSLIPSNKGEWFKKFETSLKELIRMTRAKRERESVYNYFIQK